MNSPRQSFFYLGGGWEEAEPGSRYVGEVQRGRRREDVGVVFGARLLEAVQRGVAVVLGQALVLVALSGQLHRGVLGKGHAHFSAVETLAVQVAHSWRRAKGGGGSRARPSLGQQAWRERGRLAADPTQTKARVEVPS